MLHLIFGSLLSVWEAKGRCKKWGHAVLTVWPVVAPRVYPAICCSYSLFSFLGHPDKFYMCSPDMCFNHIHSAVCRALISPLREFRKYKSRGASLWKGYIAPPVTLNFVKWESIHNLEQKLCGMQLSCSGLWNHQKNNNIITNDKQKLSVYVWGLVICFQTPILYWERVFHWLRAWPSARGPWAVVDSSTKHAGWCVYVQLGKRHRGPVHTQLISLHRSHTIGQTNVLPDSDFFPCSLQDKSHTKTYDTYKGDYLVFSFIMPLCRLRRPSESKQKKGRWWRSTRKECYREAHPNIQTIALHDLCYLHTKCSPTVQHSLQGFACKVWLWSYLWSWKLPCRDSVRCLCSTNKGNLKGYQVGFCFPFEQK